MAEAYDDEADGGSQASDHSALHERAIRQFDDITMATQEERALALSDRRFVSIAGAQWEGDWQLQFENSIMVEVNKTAQGVEKIIADYRANRVTVNFRGIDKGADEQTADTLDGMFRADVYASKGQQAFDNAFEEAVQGGIGAWRLINRYEDEYDPENDYQRICFEAIVDADQSVFWDLNAKLYDKSDAKFAYVVTAMSRQAFNAEYGADKATDWPDEILKVYYDWYTPDVVRVAEYYEVRDAKAKLGIFQHRATGEERREWMADLSAEKRELMEIEGWRLMRTRMAKRCQVWKTVMSGAEVLRPPKQIAGDCIPIVPVYGKRWFIDNMERSRGHVRLAKDPQRIYNAQISKLVETASFSPIERPIFTPEQINGHAQSWADANINRAPYALINPMIDPTTGAIMATGPVGKVEPPQLPPALPALIQISGADIRELTSADDTASEAKANISAEAMDIAATRTDAKSGIYMDNMRQSMQRCGEIYQGMASGRNGTPAVYGDEGREVETMSESGEQGTAVLAEAFTDDRGKFGIRNDLLTGKYRVISDVTEATATRRDKTVKTLMNVASVSQATDPELSSVALSTALLNMDGEGMTDLQEWLRGRLVQAGVLKPTDEEAAEMQAAAEGQQPDPQAQLLTAMAGEKDALTAKAQADTALSEAKRVQTLADAELKRSQAQDNSAERKMGILERARGFFAPKAPGARDGA
jgi:hypothetical protein